MASAKDMAGLGSTGQGVPNYDIFGHHHSREPFRDKTHLLQEDVRHPRWLQPPPQVRSRAELQQARKRGRIPDASYDFDGDGVVGQLDYFIGRSFDKDNDGCLTPGERRQAKEAVNNGFLDKFMRGIDSQGDTGRPYALKQTRGVILSADNPADVSNLTYSRHHNAHHVPPHATKTALELSRLANAKGIGASLGEKFIAENAYVREPQPPHHQTHPRTCEISHIRERAEADHQASRIRGGLLPMNQPVNPEREQKMVGLGHEKEPFIKTRGQLLETRKEAMKRHGEELRAKGDELCVPHSVRRAEKAARDYEFRRVSCEGEPRTLTQLKDARRRDRIEYDMANFGNPRVAPQEFPRFSDRPDIPFWVSSPKSAREAAFNHSASAPQLSEPVHKVTDLPFGHELSRQDLPDAAHQAAAGLEVRGVQASERFGSNTVKRYTAACIDRGEGRNMPRIFDAIQPVSVGPLDLQSLELTSSMEPIRQKAMLERKEEQRRNALNPRRSQLWHESAEGQQTSMLPSKSTGSGAKGLGGDGTQGEGGLARANAVNASRTRNNTDPLRAAASEPTFRVGGEREPKFFGNTAAANSKPGQTTTAPQSTATVGVRCGGFQRLDWPPRQARATQRSGRQGGTNRKEHASE